MILDNAENGSSFRLMRDKFVTEKTDGTPGTEVIIFTFV